ncbi:MAG: PD-(D/E)XK nuclease family protein [Patescibacteria group bacterium]|nr:PD-(D/E)XK nuclease family protein [Patescibacteria group bacterium]
MSKYYKANRSSRLFDPGSKTPFKVSRSKIELFLNCPLCFYLDRRLGVAQPPGFPFSLNSAVDALLKKEFDIHRAKQTAHPLMKAYGVDAVPYEHPDINIWRENFKGLQYLHVPTNLLITGAIDDVWVNNEGELMVVDYKSTSKTEEVNIDADWQIAYKRQMEIYQWLLKNNGFEVSPTGYFVYCNGDTDKEAFDGKLEFNIKLISYTGSTDWIEGVLVKLRACLMSDILPFSGADCDYCAYRRAASECE